MQLPSNSYSIITVTALRLRRALFQTTLNADRLLQILFHYRDQNRYALHGFAIMPEHIHVLLTPATNQTIERCAQCIKGGFSHAIRDQLLGDIWQPSFHQHRIRDAEDFRNQLTYIAQNPQRRRLQNHTYVHTKWLDQIDPIPSHLK